MNLLYPNTIAAAAPPHSISRTTSLFPFPSLHPTLKPQTPKFQCISNCTPIRAELDHNTDGNTLNVDDSGGFSEDSVEVMVIGSRRDAVLDYCSASPVLSPALRFWNVVGQDLEQVGFQRRVKKQDNTLRIVEGLSAQQLTCRAVILVASAAYGSDHNTALNIISNVTSGEGVVAGIIMKPFCFEGQRRQDEVDDLAIKLQRHANFVIVLDTDALLKNDLVTLDEALKTLNDAVLMAMNAISILVSDKHMKLLNKKDNSSEGLQLPEFYEIFRSFKEARIAFGTGYNVKTSLLRAINECPFLGVDVKDLSGVIVCIFASSGVMDSSDANTVLQTIRPILGWNSEIIVSIVHEPTVEPNAILTTIIASGYARQQLSPRTGILSSLSQRFPFIFNIFKKQYQQPANSEEANTTKNVSDAFNSPAIDNMPEDSFYDTTEDLGDFSDKPQSDEEFYSLSNYSREREYEIPEAESNSSSHELDAEGQPIFNRELLMRGNLGPGHSTEISSGATFPEATTLVDNVIIYKLPVGVKHLEKLADSPLDLNIKQGGQREVDDNKKQQYASKNISWRGTNGAGFGTVPDLDDNVPPSSRSKVTSSAKKQGGLSVRAASMLESERDSRTKWTRVVKMNYRGGVYRGRAQGGLPEGKGRLLLSDGSIYEGMWRYGKRSGLGTLYFNNGDVFQGSWRDDVMHGKGWLYFHTGDRWFVNFWKGKASGESRFYSCLGDVFFGHFKDGWRHGNFLRINVDGTRYQEVWSEGVLISEEQLDPDVEVS